MRVVLGVGGGIAAYKACELVRQFGEGGHQVTVVPTDSALRFVGSATWEALSGNPVSSQVWDEVHQVRHVRIGQAADLVLVAPATADLLAKAAHGLADDLLTATLLTASCPVVFAPAMHTEMWEHPATQANVATLRTRGCVVIEPASGRLTGADSGTGRLPEPTQLYQYAVHLELSQGRADLAGRRVVVSAGGTREALDPVRYLGNRSSGRQGFSLAAAAAARGAEVQLVAANVELEVPIGVGLIAVESTQQLSDAVMAAAADADAVVMAAAPADFRPAQADVHKIKKRADGTAPHLDLVQNPDILAGLVASRLKADQVLVGFAAETGDPNHNVLELGAEKLRRKGCDLLVINDVSGGAVFGSANNAATIIGRHGVVRPEVAESKDVLAHVIWDAVDQLWPRPLG